MHCNGIPPITSNNNVQRFCVILYSLKELMLKERHHKCLS